MNTHAKLFLLLVSISCKSAFAMKGSPNTTSGDHYEGRGNCFSGYGSGHCTSSGNASSSGSDRAGGGMSGMEAFTAGFSIGANIYKSAASGNAGQFMENIQAAKQLLGTASAPSAPQTLPPACIPEEHKVKWHTYGDPLKDFLTKRYGKGAI